MSNNPSAVAVKEEHIIIHGVQLKKTTAVVATEQGLVCADNNENVLKALI